MLYAKYYFKSLWTWFTMTFGITLTLNTKKFDLQCWCLCVVVHYYYYYEAGLFVVKKHISRTSNRPLATGKILRSTCKACSGSDRKGSQQRAKVTSTVTAIFTSENSLHGGQTGGGVGTTRTPTQTQNGTHTHKHGYSIDCNRYNKNQQLYIWTQ